MVQFTAEPQEPDITNWKELDEHAQRVEAAAPCQFMQSCRAQAQSRKLSAQSPFPGASPSRTTLKMGMFHRCPQSLLPHMQSPIGTFCTS